MGARKHVYLIRIASRGGHKREPVLARKHYAQPVSLGSQFSAERASGSIPLRAFNSFHLPNHDIRQNREAVGLPVRMALRLANHFTRSLPRHHAWAASREIGVDLTPEVDHTHDASHIQP